MKKHQSNIETPLPVYSHWLECIEELEGISFPSDCVALFLAADFSLIKKSDLVDIAKSLILRGVHYICCWGNECELGHDCFDEANVILEIDDEFTRHVMSSWHSAESLDEALFFCLFNATPDDEYWDVSSTFVVGIGSTVTENMLAELLDDMASLTERAVNT